MPFSAAANLEHHPQMTDQRDDLRATEQAIHHDATTIAELEEQKAKLEPTDPKVEQISDQIQEIARSLTDKTAAEQELVDEIQAPEKHRRRN
jgi:TRAP-type mannitol/chloroaromatic compound transport system substrate-binding protein